MSDAKFQNLFIKPLDTYVREGDLHMYYVEDAAKYLSVMTGQPVEATKAFVMAQLKPGGQFEFKSPQVEYLDRGENGDRVTKNNTLFNYLQSSLKDEEMIAPSFTTYLNPKVHESILSQYVEENIAARNVAKKEMFVARSMGDSVLEDTKSVEQKGRKLSNNAISGAHVSPSTPLFNKTAHSTLTSTCRVTSAYGNANNEKYLAGNRHYFNYHVVLNNIMAVINNTNYEQMQAVVDKYGIHLPTAEETAECVAYSTHWYWWDKKQAGIVQDLINKLTPLQRAAFVYSGDAYHLRKHNHGLVFSFLTKLSNKITGVHPDPMAIIKAAPENYVNLAHQICCEEMKGMGKKYKEIENTHKIHTLALTLENIADTIWDYQDMIQAFWMPEILPASVSSFPDSIRRVAVTSDTDSTIFTVQDWIIWYNGFFEFNDRTKAVYAAVVFLASATITHVLAKMSANLGILPKNLTRIKMKSEFTFDVFIPTQLGKHYFAAISCQEGNVFEEVEYEIKGAQLRSSNAPPHIVGNAKKMMQEIINTVMDNKKISLKYYLTWVADIERLIAADLINGGLGYLRSGSIKDIGSYAGEAEDSPYQNHYLWNEVFGPKYGMMENPPYDTFKVSVKTGRPVKLRAWLDKMEDKDLAARMRNYLGRIEKTDIGTFNLPKAILKSTGIPKEIVDVIDVEGIQFDVCKVYYLILEVLGYYSMGDKMKRLLSKNGY